ncbi:MAG TPA: hypothetical protein VGU26_03020 [Gaiellaceae bacterium]|nr:hypothetical protein [Gaiellaceae bacterium]
MAKRFDPRAKARKQKIVAAVLGVVFLGVMVYQAPTILGLFGGGSSEVATEPAPPPPPAAPAPASGAPAAPAAATPAASGSAELVDSDPAALPAQGQLVTFDRFASKDPFVQQAEPQASTPTPARPEPAKPKKRQGGPSLTVTRTLQQPGTPSSTAVRSAKISVNGVSSDVTVGGTFPEADPIFKLVSLTKSAVKVGIVDGTYATGAQAITLRKGGKPVTLMNTADGTTYVLRLVAVA